MRGKLPTNESLLKFGKVAEECYCCYKIGRDDISHILITGNFAKHIWKYHASRVGVIQANINLRSQLMQWSNLQEHDEVHKLLIHILPNYIC